MGNSGSQAGRPHPNRPEDLGTEPPTPIREYMKVRPQLKVLPDPESRQRLRHTNNGDILQSGGTLSGRQNSFQNAASSSYLPMHTYSINRTFTTQHDTKTSSQNSFTPQVKSYKSEPDLRQPHALIVQELKEKKSLKKYKAPHPPRKETPNNWEEAGSDEFSIPRRARLFKTRVESKKDFVHSLNQESVKESNSDIIEEKILARQNSLSHQRPNGTSSRFILREHIDGNDVSKHLGNFLDESPSKSSNKKMYQEENNVFDLSDISTHLNSLDVRHMDSNRQMIRGEPSGKESSTSELSPILRDSIMKEPKSFYFGMEGDDSDKSSTCHIEDEEEEENSSKIALRLRPVLPRKPPQISHFSPVTAWRLLDARSQDSGISGDARPPLCSSWIPQHDLEDDSSLEETRRELPKPLSSRRPHVFSLSLPRDLQPPSSSTHKSNKNAANSLKKLRRSVSGVLNTLSSKKEIGYRDLISDQYDANWFLSRSAPNSINENSPDTPDSFFSSISPTSRVMYLPENSPKIGHESVNRLSSFSKSCSDLKAPQSLCDMNHLLPSKEEAPKRHKKFTFQSTIRQIERRRMAEKLSKEAELKEKQRLRELEAMKQVEEEFQKKRDKEKVNIRQQLRLYAMDENQWSSLPVEIDDMKFEDRQEPDGAFASQTSSPTQNLVSYDAPFKDSSLMESKREAHTTRELSEYRQMQRDYKDYVGISKFSSSDIRQAKLTTVYPEVTYKMPNVKEPSHRHSNYRKDFAYGMLNSKLDNCADDLPQIYRSQFSPITKF